MTEEPEGFAPVLAVGKVLADLTVPWWIAGGWAIELAAGRATRRHGDVDVMIFERDEHALRELDGVELRLVEGPDDQEQPWPSARRPLAGSSRFKIRSPELPLPTEILLGPAVRDTWVYHRGNHSITRPLTKFTGKHLGLPYLPPEVVLAMKAAGEQKKDTHDFHTALPLLDSEQRQWLADAATGRWQVYRRLRADDPMPSEHPWLRHLLPTRGRQP